MTRLLVAFSLLLFNNSFSQFGELQIIDNTIASAGATSFAVADLDADGDNELISSFTGANGCLAYYNNLGNGEFSERIILGDPAFARDVGVGFFNDDDLPDIIVVSISTPQLRLYLNGSVWDNGLVIDDSFTMQINGVVFEDFDSNGSDDIVLIAQHSIDFYRNNGNGSFSKEAILTTETSSEVLECLSIDIADVDNDGDIDLIGGETAGLVIYTNDGNGIFSPNFYSPEPEIAHLAVPIDVDNDNHIDVFVKNSTDQLRWYRNNGDGTFALELTVDDVHDIKDAAATDYNHDGYTDLLISYTNNVAAMLNVNGEGFANEIILHTSSGLLMGAVFAAQLDGINGDDFVWSGGNNTVAYFPCSEETVNSGSKEIKDGSINLFPNPVANRVSWNKNDFTHVKIYSSLGKLMLNVNAQGKYNFDVTSLSSGVYYLHAVNEEGGVRVSRFIKN